MKKIVSLVIVLACARIYSIEPPKDQAPQEQTVMERMKNFLFLLAAANAGESAIYAAKTNRN